MVTPKIPPGKPTRHGFTIRSMGNIRITRPALVDMCFTKEFRQKRVGAVSHGASPMRATPALLLTVGLLACGDTPLLPGEGPIGGVDPSFQCRFFSDDLFAAGASRDGIPALVNPPLVLATHPDAQYVEQYARGNPPVEARVVGLVVDGVPVAIPHNILWWHEIVNLDLGGRRLTVSYCPLTGSTLVFDATAAGTQRFGVSGLILENNLVMFDEETGSLWPQMCQLASAGDRAGTRLVQVPAVEMLWDTWKTRHPETMVVSSDTGWDREYTRNPHEGYELSDVLFFPSQDSIDARRPMKERVLGIPDGAGGLAIPFGVLEQAGNIVAFSTTVAGELIQVLWDGEARAARAFFPRTTDGTAVSIQTANGQFVDTATGSVWNIEGLAMQGPLAGSQLAIQESSFVAYWFAWAAFHPDTRLWTQE